MTSGNSDSGENSSTTQKSGSEVRHQKVVLIPADVIIIHTESEGGESTVLTKQIKTQGSGGDPPSFPIAICPATPGELFAVAATAFAAGVSSSASI